LAVFGDHGDARTTGQTGTGSFILSTDGNSLTGEDVTNGIHFTWNGQRAP
jgi:hypothetical protein